MIRVSKGYIEAWKAISVEARKRLIERDLANGTDFVSSGRLDAMAQRMLANNRFDLDEFESRVNRDHGHV